MINELFSLVSCQPWRIIPPNPGLSFVNQLKKGWFCSLVIPRLVLGSMCADDFAQLRIKSSCFFTAPICQVVLVGSYNPPCWLVRQYVWRWRWLRNLVDRCRPPASCYTARSTASSSSFTKFGQHHVRTETYQCIGVSVDIWDFPQRYRGYLSTQPTIAPSGAQSIPGSYVKTFTSSYRVHGRPRSAVTRWDLQ